MVALALEYAAPPVVSVRTDRLPLAKKIHILSERGLWPQLERLVRAHGWDGERTAQFIDDHLPKAQCAYAGCSEWYYAYSKRVKYCSDKCRRAASNAPHEPEATAAPAPVITAVQVGELCIKLVRSGIEGKTKRFYTLMVVQDLFGGVSVHRQWGRERLGEGQRRTDRYESLQEAVKQFAAQKALATRRGYREEGD